MADLDASRSMRDVGEITQLLEQLGRERGVDREAVLEELMPLVYEELKILARANRYRWNGRPDLGTTSLVHEAYLKLSAEVSLGHSSRRQFYALASKAMRNILIDNARWHQRQKRGGGTEAVSFEDSVLVSSERCEELVALDEALGRLEEREPRLVRIVECRCFGGLTVDETALVLEISPATVKRGWSLARSWLYRELQTVAI